jgi:hypothetical protein
MDETSRDTPLRLAAFDHMRRLAEVHDHLTATELKPGFVFEGERIPLMNPQRGIFTLVVARPNASRSHRLSEASGSWPMNA